MSFKLLNDYKTSGYHKSVTVNGSAVGEDDKYTQVCYFKRLLDNGDLEKKVVQEDFAYEYDTGVLTKKTTTVTYYRRFPEEQGESETIVETFS